MLSVRTSLGIPMYWKAWICGGQTAWVSRVIYALVGLAGLWCIVTLLTRDRKTENS